jgi:transcriptional regulator of nitric oxide reductase
VHNEIKALVTAIAALLLVVLSCVHAFASYVDAPPPLMDRLTPEVTASVFPEADRVEPAGDAGPPAAKAFRGDQLLGYIFSTLDVVRAPGYQGSPVDISAGVDLSGTITGAVMLYQQEPLIMEDERRTELMTTFLHDTRGMSSKSGATDGPKPRFIAGASTSARAFRTAIRGSASAVLAAYEGRNVVTEPTLDTEGYRQASLDDLLADGSIVSQTVTNADLGAALEQAGLEQAKPEVPPRGGPDAVYMEFHAALATPAMIGRNVLGGALYDRVRGALGAGAQAILLSATGPYDFQGFKFQNKSSGYALERLRIVQGDKVFTFDKSHYIRLRSALGDVTGVVILDGDSGFDPLQPWSAQVLAYAPRNGKLTPVALPLLPYALPDRYVLTPEPEVEPMPAWMEAWTADLPNEIILGVALAALTAILALQSLWTRKRLLHRIIRTGFLTFTLVWLGWIAGGQLSIVHIVNYLRAPFERMDIGFYLAEPLIVMISIYAAVSLLLLGRGVFCGWLCPFGALQELLAQAARLFRLPQWNPSVKLQQKLWWGKYASLAVIVVLAFTAPTAESYAAEVEPFKTAITSYFIRALPFVAYALVLLGLSLFTERFFCRFLCPLGGALAILDRLHLLNLLKRRPECGSPCHLCEHSCPVKAIAPSGKINMAECFQCLDCQVEYYDDHRCPPLAQQRKHRQRNGQVPRPELVIGRRASA